jgi:DNA-binding LacI/PurR family transcriptional regulator
MDKMDTNVTIYDIAKEAKVSIATVSRVINGNSGVREKTRKKVEAAIKKYNYSPSALARGLVNNTTNTIGILVDDIRKPYYASTIYGMERKLNSMGFVAMLCNTGGDYESNTNYLRILAEKKIDGLVLISSILNEETMDIDVLKSFKNIPIIAINTLQSLTMDNLYHVIRDEMAAVDLCVQDFAGKGRKKILFAEVEKAVKYLVDNDRTSFSSALLKNNLDPDVCRFAMLKRSIAAGEQAIEDLSAEGFPYDAIISRSAETAIGMVNGIKKLGHRVPEDTSVVIMTDSPYLSIYNPGISAVTFKHEELGYTAATMLDGAIKGDPTPHVITIRPSLIDY